jgi:hypothetical protein
LNQFYGKKSKIRVIFPLNFVKNGIFTKKYYNILQRAIVNKIENYTTEKSIFIKKNEKMLVETKKKYNFERFFNVFV